MKQHFKNVRFFSEEIKMTNIGKNSTFFFKKKNSSINYGSNTKNALSQG